MRYQVHGCLLIVTLAAMALPARSLEQGEGPGTQVAHIDTLGSFDYAARTQAARLLRRTPAPDAVPLLSAAVRAHEDEFVRFRALVLLTGFNDRGTGVLMRELLGDPSDRIREVAYSWFEQHPDPALTASLLAALQHEGAEFVRPALVSALAALADADPQVQRALLFEIGRGMDFFRTAVIEILGRHRAAYAVDAIAGAARQPGALQYDAVLALGRIRDTRAIPVLEGLASAPADVQLARAAALCLVAARCETHLADAMRTAVAPGTARTVVRAAVTALVVTALDGDDLRAASVLYELASAGDLVRDEAARGFGTLGIRGPDRLLDWLDRIPDEARDPAFDLIADGAGRMDEHFLKEQLFTALRAAYWRAPEGSTGRDVAGALIEKLEF